MDIPTKDEILANMLAERKKLEAEKGDKAKKKLPKKQTKYYPHLR